MFSGILKADDVEVYETVAGVNASFSLSEDCKSNIIIRANVGSTFLSLPSTAYIGKRITITSVYCQTPTGKPINSGTSIFIQYANTTLFTLKQGTVEFMYIGMLMSGLTDTDKAKVGWIVLGGTQGDASITGMNRSVAIGNSAGCISYGGVAIGASSYATTGVSVGDSAFTYDGIAIKGNAQGSRAVCIGANYANGQDSVSIGSSASSGGTESIAIGKSATTSGYNYGISIGSNSLCNDYYGISIGNSANSAAMYGIALGRYSFAPSSKISMKANEQFSTSGDAQAGKFILMRQTANGTATVLTATNSAPSSTNILNLPNNATYAFKGIVVAKDDSTLDSAMWEVIALMKRGSNASTTALVGTPTITKVFADAGASTWSIALTADTTNGGGIITVTGEASKTIRWVTNIDSAEVI